MKNITIIDTIVVTIICIVTISTANAGCVATHPDSFFISETSSTPVDSVAALEVTEKCVSKAFDMGLNPCNCRVACSPVVLVDSVEIIVAKVIESFIISNGLPPQSCDGSTVLPPQNHGCSFDDFDICKQSGSSCFLSTNGGSHPDPSINAGDQVALCWWEEVPQISCSDSGGIWSTAANFGDKFDWSSPSGGWGQCMSQCGNIGGSSCTNP